jgi:hypothetical protein
MYTSALKVVTAFYMPCWKDFGTLPRTQKSFKMKPRRPWEAGSFHVSAYNRYRARQRKRTWNVKGDRLLYYRFFLFKDIVK